MLVKLFLFSLLVVGMIMGVYLLRRYFFKKENADVFHGLGQNMTNTEMEIKEVVFKTDFLCAGCVSRLTPHINKLEGIDSWSIDLKHPDKLLRIKGVHFSEEEVILLLKKHGYSATKT